MVTWSVGNLASFTRFDYNSLTDYMRPSFKKVIQTKEIQIQKECKSATITMLPGHLSSPPLHQCCYLVTATAIVLFSVSHHIHVFSGQPCAKFVQQFHHFHVLFANCIVGSVAAEAVFDVGVRTEL